MNVISFPRKRGRPKIIREEKDMGTQELQFKRAHGMTMEALDLCLYKDLITQQQHWCGIHLRWLYTLRHGAPGVRAVDPTHVEGIDLKPDDPNWRALREAEYHEAMQKVNGRRCASVLTNICIHNEWPRFLTCRAAARNAHDLEQLRDALDILATHWKRGKRGKHKD